MANDLFGGLGGLMKGLSGFMPQDDPAVKLMNAQTQVNELKQQEEALYAQIGQMAIQKYGPEAFGEPAERLKLTQANLRYAEEKLKEVMAENEEAKAREKAAREACTCPNCGFENPEGIKFCQECGSKLGTSKNRHCASCGAVLPAGVRFCGECGARQEV